MTGLIDVYRNTLVKGKWETLIQNMTREEKRWRDAMESKIPGVSMVYEFDPKYIDEAIRPMVMRLREAAFDTFCSCEGGKDSCSNLPFVMMFPDVGFNAWQTLERLDKWLQENGVKQFQLRIHMNRGGRTRLERLWNGVPDIEVKFPQFYAPPFHKGVFTHKQHAVSGTNPNA